MSALSDASRSTQILISTFYVGETLMGIDTLRVQEVIRGIEMTTVHHAPVYILGIVNLRGRIVTIIDLAKKLELTTSPLMGNSRIIIVLWSDEYVGLLVDSISDVIYADRSGLMPPPSNIKELQGRFFEGVYNNEGHLISLVDIDKVLADDEKGLERK